MKIFARKYRHDKRILSRQLRRRRRIMLAFSSLSFFAGSYLLVLSLAPRYQFLAGPASLATPVVEANEGPSVPTGNRLIVEKLGLNLPYGPRQADLSTGAWQRYADRSDPVKGGNMILAGHRFELGWTPQQTKARSPFYKIDTLVEGDVLKVVFEDKEYSYEVTRRFHVESKDTWVEDNSAEHKLTVYSCELGGADKGRVVVEATPL